MTQSTAIPLKAMSKIRITEPLSCIAEIRLRAGRPAVSVSIFGEMRVCSKAFSAEEIADCFAEICRYSVHTFQEEIAQGFVTLDGGHRVGICGTAVKNGGRIEFLKDISGLNIRIAHEAKGSANELYERLFARGLRSVIIAGRPLSGKTTVLRDLARQLGERHRVTLIDSRNELSASFRGTPTLDVGLNTDVLCGCEKTEGIMLSLRSMSPEIIICDEIANDEKAIEQALFCGVKIVASAHAASVSELKNRPQTRVLMPYFDAAAVLSDCGKISEVYENGA